MNRRSFINACAGALVFPRAAIAREVHGSADIFVAPDVALAWAILRGAGDAATVVIRVLADQKAFSTVAVVGIDPFTKAEASVLPATAITESIDIRIARASFADFPRTEIRLYSGAANAPTLNVFYLGIPDTTPEFNDGAKLDEYLSERLRARAGGITK